MTLLRELAEQRPDDAVPIMDAIRAAMTSVLEEGRTTSAGKVRNHGGASDFFNSNTKLVVGAAAMALSSHRAYQKNKRGTFTLHARDAYERRMITRIVDSMVQSKKFKIARTKFQGKGKTWVMKTV